MTIVSSPASTVKEKVFQTPTIIYADGLCEPRNPGGYACFGWAAFQDDTEIASGRGCCGRGPSATNNRAEYRAAIEALEWAATQGIRGVTLKTDSQLVVFQVRGAWTCRASHLFGMVERVRWLLSQVDGRIEWIPRRDNAQADALSRAAYVEAREGSARCG